ncbi:MAG: hypothetical protein ACRDU4_15915 [Mycobacterium sp.]
MSRDDRQQPPDVEHMAHSMLFLYGPHDDHDHEASGDPGGGPWSKAPDFADNPARAAVVAAASQRDREHYLNEGLTQVDCRFCHATVAVKKLGPSYTAVQWNSGAAQRCAYFAELRAEGGNSSRARSCPKLTDSIKHAVAEGLLTADD